MPAVLKKFPSELTCCMTGATLPPVLADEVFDSSQKGLTCCMATTEAGLLGAQGTLWAMKAAAFGLAALAIGIQTLRWIIAKTDIESEDDGLSSAPATPEKKQAGQIHTLASP